MSKRLNKDQKVLLFEFYVEGKAKHVNGQLTKFIKNKIENCDDFKERNVCNETIRTWTSKFKDQGFTTAESRAYTKNPRKVTPEIASQIKKQLLNHPSLKTASNKLYTKKKKNVKISLSTTTIHRYRKKLLSIAYPKRTKLILTNHHKTMRKKFGCDHRNRGKDK